MKTRVLFVIGSMGGGGSERQVVHLLKHLDRSKFAPRLFLFYRQGPLLAEVPADVPIDAFWDCCSLPRMNWPGRIHLAQVRRLTTLIREEGIHVVYDRTYHATLVAGPAAERARVPRISVIVNDPRMDLERNERRFVWLKRRALRKAYRRATRVLAVSEGTRQAAIDYYGLPPSKVETFLNPIDVDRIERLSQEPGPKLAAEQFHVIAMGRLHSQKGFETLLEAAYELVHSRRRSQLHFHLVGAGPLQQQLKRFVHERQLHDQVTFWGFLENPFPLLRQGHLFCLPSVYEGNSNALLEALACGIPVVAAYGAGGTRETLAQGRWGKLVPPGDSHALADAIDKALHEPRTFHQTAAAAQRHVRERFAIEPAVRRFETLLVHVAEEGAPS